MFLTSYLSASLRRFVKDEEAASAIEYVLIIAMVALVIVTLTPGVGSAITTAFGKVTTALNGV